MDGWTKLFISLCASHLSKFPRLTIIPLVLLLSLPIPLSAAELASGCPRLRDAGTSTGAGSWGSSTGAGCCWLELDAIVVVVAVVGVIGGGKWEEHWVKGLSEEVLECEVKSGKIEIDR